MELTSVPWNFSWYTLNATMLPVRPRPHMWGPVDGLTWLSNGCCTGAPDFCATSLMIADCKLI
ncbi:hypothetical protein K439DRAFT_1630128 [Ramaria rubella]|nr:hypothetical protein K439DRAFT_1630128 [Ramaria rubella]